jgi:hypothetical protein
MELPLKSVARFTLVHPVWGVRLWLSKHPDFKRAVLLAWQVDRMICIRSIVVDVSEMRLYWPL